MPRPELKRVLLAGATGLAGSSVLAALRRRLPDTEVRALYHKHTRPFLLLDDPQVSYMLGDLCDEADCRRAAAGCDAAVLCAALTGGAAFLQERAREHVETNLSLGVRLLGACAQARVRRAVWVGSATMYQESEAPLRERDLDWGRDPSARFFGFGWAQRFLEKYGEFLRRSLGLEVAVARCANIYGPFAPFSPERANVVAALVRKAVDKQDPFEVWGSPKVTRDLLFAEDFAEAVLRLLQVRPCPEGPVNLGSGRAVTVAAIARCALQYAGHQPARLVYSPDKPRSFKSLVLDVSRAKQVLGWEPAHTLEAGMAKTVAWWRENRSWWKR